MQPLFDKMDTLGLRPLKDPNEQVPVEQSDITKLEGIFGYHFPPLYSEFVLRYGISAFYTDYATFDVPDNWDKITESGGNDVRAFFGIDKEEHNIWNLEGEIKSARHDRIPAYLLPICTSDGLPTIVYISCREQDYGHVYALSRTQIWDVMTTEDAEQAAFHIADSFEDFLENLHVGSYEDPSEIQPVFAAMLAGDVSYLQNIVDSGEMETYRSQYGVNLLEYAIFSGLGWPVEFLLKNNISTDRAISTAIQYGNIDAISLLLSHGVNVNAPLPINHVSPDWHTALIQAVQNGDFFKKYEMARLLVEAGANVEMQDSQGKTALDYVHPQNQKMRDILLLKK